MTVVHLPKFRVVVHRFIVENLDVYAMDEDDAERRAVASVEARPIAGEMSTEVVEVELSAAAEVTP